MRRNVNEHLKRLDRVLSDICEDFHGRIYVASEIVDEAMKRLALPTSNITAVVLMREALRDLLGARMCRFKGGSDHLTHADELEKETKALFKH